MEYTVKFKYNTLSGDGGVKAMEGEIDMESPDSIESLEANRSAIAEHIAATVRETVDDTCGMFEVTSIERGNKS